MEETMEERFDEQFLCNKPEHMNMSDHQFAHDKQGRLPQAFKDFVRDELSRQAEQIIREIECHKFTRQMQTASESSCYKCGFSNDKRLCLCPHNDALEVAINSIRTKFVKECEHDFIDARNKVVESGSYCSKCGLLKNN